METEHFVACHLKIRHGSDTQTRGYGFCSRHFFFFLLKSQRLCVGVAWVNTNMASRTFAAFWILFGYICVQLWKHDMRKMQDSWTWSRHLKLRQISFFGRVAESRVTIMLPLFFSLPRFDLMLYVHIPERHSNALVAFVTFDLSFPLLCPSAQENSNKWALPTQWEFHPSTASNKLTLSDFHFTLLWRQIRIRLRVELRRIALQNLDLANRMFWCLAPLKIFHTTNPLSYIRFSGPF